MTKWTNNAYAELLKQHREGERLCDAARRLCLSTTRIREVLQRAERLERRTDSPLDGLSVRTRNCLICNEIRTVEDIRAALADGSIDDIPNIGKLSKIEIRRWLYNLTPNGGNMEQFYLQDSRGYVGNDVLWWAKDGNGYTTDLSKAEVYSREDAQRMHDSRRSDVPWPKSYIDANTRHTVDMQDSKRDEVLADTGIVLTPEPKPKKETINCHQCGRFLSEQQLWSGECPKCGADNRP